MGTPVSSAAFSSGCRGDSTLPSPAFYRAVYSQIEEVGWEHLMGAAGDLSCLTFRLSDTKGRVHKLEISLPRSYPGSSPTIAADVPCINEVVWSEKSRLKDVVQLFDEHLQKLQEFWSTMDDIDRDLCVVYPKESSLATSYRQIGLGNDCYLLLHISTSSPRSLPECRFFGPDSAVVLMRNNWKKNAIKWKVDKPFHENLGALLERELPGPPVSSKEDELVDCGICYAPNLPVGNVSYPCRLIIPAEYISNLMFLKTMNLELTAEVHQTISAKILVAVKLFIPSASEIGCIPLQQRGSHLMFCLESAPIVLNRSQLKLITDVNSETSKLSIYHKNMSVLDLCV